MLEESKRQLAQWYMDTVAEHEKSYNRNSHQYDTGWRAATVAVVTDASMVPLVYAMAAGGYCDFHEWATNVLGTK